MNYAFSNEQEQFRDMVRRFLREHASTTEARRLMATDDGYDPTVWRKLSTELALPAIHIPEAYGGGGFSPVELGIVMEELGRSLLCAPYFSTSVLAASAITLGASEAQKLEWLPRMAAGEKLATLAVAERSGRWDGGDIELTAQPQGDGYLLNGTKALVIDGLIADWLVVAGIDQAADNSIGLFFLPADSAGVSRRALDSIDATRKLALVEFDAAPATRLEAVDPDGRTLQAVFDLALIALANEMVGGAQVLLETAVEYARLRVQFGRTIGSFQAIKHKCADMLLEVESARSAAYQAAAAAAEGADDVSALASLAKAAAADAYLASAASCIQIHGGVGFTWENDTHLWFKRAKCSEVLLGDPIFHRERMLECWGI